VTARIPDAPRLAIDYSNIGSSLIGLARYAEAQVALEHAAKLAAGADPDSFWIGWALQYDGLALVEMGDPTLALSRVQRGLEIAGKRGAPGKKLLPGLLTVEGRALLGAKAAAAAAEAACKQAADIQEKRGALAPDRVYDWDALECLGEALLARGRTDEALAALRQSVSLTRRVYPNDLARAQTALARALSRRRDLAPEISSPGSADPSGRTPASDRAAAK
jgi:tetratricopeptide (TPR) repeat protein